MRENIFGKECYHFTQLNRAFSIRKYGLNARVEKNSQSVKDSAKKVSFSDGKYAAAGLMANFYKVYTDIKTGTRDKSKTDSKLAKRVCDSKSFEEFLGDGMYLMFDGSNIENTGGNNGHINPFDAGTKETIEPDNLKVCVLKNEQTGEISYSKFDFAQYLMMNLTEDDYSKMPNEIIDDIKLYRQTHMEEMKKIKNVGYKADSMTLDEFCQTFKNEIEEDIRKQSSEKSKNISMESAVRNAITQGTTKETVEQTDREEENIRSERSNYTSSLNQ